MRVYSETNQPENRDPNKTNTMCLFFLEKRRKEIEGDDCRGGIVETSERQKKVYTYNQVSKKCRDIQRRGERYMCVRVCWRVRYFR